MDRFGAGLLRSRENRIDQEIRILRRRRADANGLVGLAHMQRLGIRVAIDRDRAIRSEEHTSELQSLMRISYAVFCLKKKKHIKNRHKNQIVSEYKVMNNIT